SPQTPPAITRDALVAALKILNLEFAEEHLALMLPRVNRALGTIDGIRKISVPLDTEPAVTFCPLLPGKKWPKTAKYQPSRPAPRRDWKKVEDLAFWPVTDLAPLLRAKRVKSVDLTKMYLERLKEFKDKLNFVITLTDDLALDQAKRSDGEIRRGKYRGPL